MLFFLMFVVDFCFFLRLLSATSPSERFRAVLKSANEKQFLEIWQSHNVTKVIDLNALDLHGDVYTDGNYCNM
jgi:acylaminoacyl-peptidase